MWYRCIIKIYTDTVKKKSYQTRIFFRYLQHSQWRCWNDTVPCPYAIMWNELMELTNRSNHMPQ